MLEINLDVHEYIKNLKTRVWGHESHAEDGAAMDIPRFGFFGLERGRNVHNGPKNHNPEHER